MNEYGRGFVTSERDVTDEVYETQLGTNGVVGATGRVDTVIETAPSDPVPGLAGLSSTLIAWQQTSSSGAPEIAWNFAQGGTTLGSTMIASTPTAGPTDAADGLDDGGDVNGDAAVAWVQGSAGDFSIETDELLEPPGQATPTSATTEYTRASTPTLTWSAGRESWGPLTYTVFLNNKAVGTTTGTSFTVPSALNDGSYNWQVQAANQADQTSLSPKATVFVDTYPPRLRVRLTGRLRTGIVVTVHVAAGDVANPAEIGARASGIAGVRLTWGDGTKPVVATTLGSAAHTYRRQGLYRLTVTAVDEAGNVTTVSHYLRILP